ncbi:MAG: redoxin domain-containing protein, partial [Planctomycetota bacterium]|nr:redoxin domain-containing protein [Planctomycetota bacterium]
MSLINKEVADFSVQAFQNNEFKTVDKAGILGKWSVFFFYPADFTFVCPTELEDLADKYADFKAAGCEIHAVSCDTHFVHKAWHD